MAMELNLGPRVSFSHSPTFTRGSSFRHPDDSLVPVDPAAEDFDFSTRSYEASSQQLREDYSSTPADLLFSQGMLLPLYNNQQPPPQLLPKPNTSSSSCNNNNNKQQLLNIGRSSSVSSSKTKTGGQFIARSKSTGCNLNHQSLQQQQYYPSKSTSRRPAQEARTTSSRFWKSPSESSSSSSASAKAYYYRGDRRVASCGNGVRINPVINVPAPFIPRGGSSGSSSNGSTGGGGRTASSRTSFFAYLLCSCGEKNNDNNNMESN